MIKILAVNLIFIFYSYKVTFGKNKDCEVIKYVSHVKVSYQKLITTDTVIFKVNNRMGDNYTDITIPYSKRSGLSGLSVWLEDGNGKLIRYVKKDEITEHSEYSHYTFYSDNLVKRFHPQHNYYPYHVCYSYTITENEFIDVADWSPRVKENVPVNDAILYCDIPKDFKVHIFKENIQSENIDTLSGNVRYKWMASYNNSNEDEEYSPSENLILPKIYITPEIFKYGVKGSFTSWQTFGKWVADLNKGADELPENEKNIALSLVKNANTNLEKTKILYSYLQQHTHYVNVTIDKGGYKPYPAEYVAQNKYGDCKALSIYMKALLKAVGINSYYTLINSGLTPESLTINFPFPEFNHAILIVPLSNDTLWLDNTDNLSPFGYINSSIQNREALMIDGLKSKIIRCPAKTSSENLNLKMYDFKIEDNNRTLLIANYTYKGINYEFFNYLKSNASEYDKDQYIHKRFAYFNCDSLSWNLSNKYIDSAQIDLSAGIILSDFFKHIDNSIIIPYLQISMPDFQTPTKRKSPVFFPYPICERDIIVYHITKNRTINGLPEIKSIISDFGKYNCEIKITDDSITIIKDLLLKPMYIPLSSYKDFYQFISSVQEFEKKVIVLN